MKLLQEIREQDFNADAPEIDPSGFDIRKAARAVVADAEGRVALLHVGKYGYHKLPGGGIDEGEDIPAALARELLEEIGCEADVHGEIGEIVEYRDWLRLKQISYCHKAKQVGEKGSPDFTESELAEGFEIVWADNLNSAIALLEADAPSNHEGKFIQKRDLAFLNGAKGFE